MPYPRNSSLPKAVKDTLPAAAQTIYRNAYNSAEEKGWSESRRNKYAWGAVKNAGYKKPQTGKVWVKLMQVFLSDLQKYELEYEERDQRMAVKGLPVLRSGTWKGIPFEPARLSEIAESFAAIKDADDWMPPVRPRHPTEAEWRDDTWDTTQNLGVVEALRYDPEADVLFADIEVDAATGEKMRGGNVRYVSSEFTDYQSPNTGALYENAFRGVAFVDNPAVKNIGWLSALNAEEFESDIMPQSANLTDVQSDVPRTGGVRMSIWDKIKAAVGLTDEQVGKLEVLEAAEGDDASEDDADVTAEQTTDDSTDNTDDEEPAGIPPEVAEALAVAEKRADDAEKRADDAEKVQLAEIAQRKTAERAQLLDSLSVDGTVLPAARDLLEPVFQALDGLDDNVIVLKAAKEGQDDIKVTPLQLLVEALQQNAGVQKRYLQSEVEVAGEDGKEPWSEENFPSKGNESAE